MTNNIKWLRGLAEQGGKGVVDNIDARALGRVADEIEFLLYFYQEADFGPAHEDVVSNIREYFTDETGRLPPEGYKEEE